MLQPTHSLCRCMRLHVQLRPTEMRGPGHYGTLPGCNYAAAGSSPSHYVMADDLRVMLPEPASAATAHYSTGASCPLLLRSCTPPFGVLNFSGLPRPTPMRISCPPAHYFSGDKYLLRFSRTGLRTKEACQDSPSTIANLARGRPWAFCPNSSLRELREENIEKVCLRILLELDMVADRVVL